MLTSMRKSALTSWIHPPVMKESGLLFKASLPVSSFWPIAWGRREGSGIFIRQERCLQGIPQRFPGPLLRIKRVKKFYLICTFHASRVYNADVASQNLSIYDCCRLKDKSAFGVVDTAYDGLIYRQAQADSLATALRCWSSRLCA